MNHAGIAKRRARDLREVSPRKDLRDVYPYTWSTVLDNYEPPRAYAYGSAVMYSTDDVECAFKLYGTDRIPHAERNVYVIDTGKSAEPYYVAGWNQDGEYLMLHPYPTNPNDATRPDNGRVIDYGTWALGPRKSYHIKASPVTE